MKKRQDMNGGAVVQIYNGSIAKKLIQDGHTLINMNGNTKKKGATVFYFARDREIEEYLEEFYPTIAKSLPRNKDIIKKEK